MITRQRLLDILPGVAVMACIIGPVVMVLSDIVTVRLNPEFDPVAQTISGFADTQFGWLEKIGMGMVGVAFLLMGLSLLTAKTQNDQKLFRVTGVLFLIAAFSFEMTAVFNSNLIATVYSLHGLLHILALALGVSMFYPTCLFFMRVMMRKPGLKYFGLYSGFTYLVGFAVFLWIIFSNKDFGYLGLSERLLTGFTLLWVVLVGPRVINMTRETTAPKTADVPVAAETDETHNLSAQPH
jgi:uncharacterized membrane-anchored protein